MIYKVMLIEDDLAVRERIKSMVDWEALSAELVCEAGDSDMAMELYMLHRPKIIVTDINIPVISGLDLAHVMRKEDPELQFIVITGYHDFEKAQKTLEIGAVSLLSKPIFPGEINKSLAKAIGQIEEEYRRKTSLAAMQSIIENNIPQIQEVYISNLMRHGVREGSDVAGRMRQLGIACGGPEYLVSLCEIRSPESAREHKEELLLLLKNILQQIAQRSGCEIFPFIDSHLRLVCLFNLRLEQSDNLVEHILVRCREYLDFSKDVRLYAGIGKRVARLDQLNSTYSEALTALNYRSVLGDEEISYYKNLKNAQIIYHNEQECFAHLREGFRTGDFDTVSGAVCRYVGQMQLQEDYEVQVRKFFFEYMVCIFNEAIRMGIQMDEMERAPVLLTQLFQNTDSTTYMPKALEFTESLMKKMALQNNEATNHLISMAKTYIRNKLHDPDLNLERVSDHIGLSKTYFCRLFHQAEQVNFATFLKKERIALAKELLLGSNLKVYEISDRSGFANPKYFSFVFRQTTGMTPVEYQRQPRPK